MRQPVLLMMMAALALSGCGEMADMSLGSPLQAHDFHFPVEIGPQTFADLTVADVKRLPVNCPCQELTAHGTGVTVRVEFTTSFGYDWEVERIDSVTVNGDRIDDPATWRLLAKGLERAAQVSGDPRVKRVADALKAS